MWFGVQTGLPDGVAPRSEDTPMSQRASTTEASSRDGTKTDTPAVHDSVGPDCGFCDIVDGSEPVGETNPLVAELPIPLHTDRFVVFPDAAPIGPRHCLVVPRSHRLSFARLGLPARERATDLAADILQRLPSPKGYKPVVFEHGSREETGAGSVGCSITHAHLHLLFLPDGAVSGFSHREEFTQYGGLTAAWDSLGRADYYLYGRPDGAVWATPVAEDPALACSMFLRKRFAAAIDRPDLANYRRYQDHEADDMLPEVERTHRALLVIDGTQV